MTGILLARYAPQSSSKTSLRLIRTAKEKKNQKKDLDINYKKQPISYKIGFLIDIYKDL